MLYEVITVFILWLGWFGFNPGSTTTGDSSIAMIFVNTNQAAAAGAVAAIVITSYSIHYTKLYEVKTEPAQPENEYTGSCHGNIVARDSTNLSLGTIFADTRAKNNRTSKGAPTTHGMDHGRAGKINKAQPSYNFV